MGWIGVDLDGTLAEYRGWRGPSEIGEPIPLMLERVRRWLASGKDVRIFTARVSSASCIRNNVTLAQVRAGIWAWCDKHLGRQLPITCEKDLEMIELWDDRATQVLENTGIAVQDQVELLSGALNEIQGIDRAGPDIETWMRERAQTALEDVNKVPALMRDCLRRGHEQALLEIRQVRLRDFPDPDSYAAYIQERATKALAGA